MMRIKGAHAGKALWTSVDRLLEALLCLCSALLQVRRLQPPQSSEGQALHLCVYTSPERVPSNASTWRGTFPHSFFCFCLCIYYFFIGGVLLYCPG